MFFDWARIYFIENPGMAFGLSFGGDWGKLALTLFRIVAVFVIGVILRRVIKGDYSTLLVVSLSLILAGALGNIIDCVFYGVLFGESTRTAVAEFLPATGGYAGWFKGQVVDMLYFPIIEGHFPNWIPYFGGDSFTFFRPIFNIADSAISIGIFLILVFQRHIFKDEPEEALSHEYSTSQEKTIKQSDPELAIEPTDDLDLKLD